MSNPVFSTPSAPLYASASLPAHDCIGLMRERGVRAILLTEGDSGDQKIVGIFTESDVVRNFSRLYSAGNRFLPIREVMTSPVLALPFSEILEARALMTQKGIRTVPIIKAAGPLTVSTICGIVHAFDLIKSGASLGP